MRDGVIPADPNAVVGLMDAMSVVLTVVGICSDDVVCTVEVSPAERQPFKLEKGISLALTRL